MPDVAAFRAKLTTIVPSTNTIVEATFNHLLRVPGVTFHTGRVYIERPALDSNDAFAALWTHSGKRELSEMRRGR